MFASVLDFSGGSGRVATCVVDATGGYPHARGWLNSIDPTCRGFFPQPV